MILVYSGPSKIQILKTFGIPRRILDIGNLKICILDGPEDDPIRVERCCPEQ